MSNRRTNTDPIQSSFPEITDDVLALIQTFRTEIEAEQDKPPPTPKADTPRPNQSTADREAEFKGARLGQLLSRFLGDALVDAVTKNSPFWRDHALTQDHLHLLARIGEGARLTEIGEELQFNVHHRDAVARLRVQAVAGLCMQDAVPPPAALDVRTNRAVTSRLPAVDVRDATMFAAAFRVLWPAMRDAFQKQRDTLTARDRIAKAKLTVDDVAAKPAPTSDDTTDPVTAAILEGKKGTTAIARQFGMSAPSISSRKRALEKAGLLRPARTTDPQPLPPTAPYQTRIDLARAMITEGKGIAVTARVVGLSEYKVRTIRARMGEWGDQ